MEGTQDWKRYIVSRSKIAFPYWLSLWISCFIYFFKKFSNYICLMLGFSLHSMINEIFNSILMHVWDCNFLFNSIFTFYFYLFYFLSYLHLPKFKENYKFSNFFQSLFSQIYRIGSKKINILLTQTVEFSLRTSRTRPKSTCLAASQRFCVPWKLIAVQRLLDMQDRMQISGGPTHR